MHLAVDKMWYHLFLLLNLLSIPVTSDRMPWQQFPVHDRLESECFLPHPAPVNHSLVQGLHLALWGEGAIAATWMNPTKHAPSIRFKPFCIFSCDWKRNITSFGAAYTYKDGCFDSTLNFVIMNVSKLSSKVYDRVYYVCGDNKFGFSSIYSFQLQRPYFPIHSFTKEKSHDKNVERDTLRDYIYEKTEENVVLMDQKNEINVADYTGMKKGLNNLYKINHIKGFEGLQSNGQLIAVIGDLGYPQCSDSLGAIKDLSGLVKLVVHAGDISYADQYDWHGKPINNSYIWVSFMNDLADLATRIPYMTAPGNHESQFNFAAYKNWLPMPHDQSESRNTMWYSFDYMGVHFVSFSTEHDFSEGSPQSDWIISDLKRANLHRAQVPWIVIFGHRPLYCTSSISYERCFVEAARYRAYLEKILYEQRVDVSICGHNHDYERTFPVYNLTATDKNYLNPKATVYIVNGEAGNCESNNADFYKDVPWRAYFNPTARNGFVLMEPSEKQLKFWYMDSGSRTVIDHFVITRD